MSECGKECRVYVWVECPRGYGVYVWVWGGVYVWSGVYVWGVREGVSLKMKTESNLSSLGPHTINREKLSAK